MFHTLFVPPPLSSSSRQIPFTSARTSPSRKRQGDSWDRADAKEPRPGDE
eukprot:m.147666 g.147666  ORF g.147666 m.147666 type:complete len:50 (+) comp9710_c0_seq3:215-364(+)